MALGYCAAPSQKGGYGAFFQHFCGPGVLWTTQPKRGDMVLFSTFSWHLVSLTFFFALNRKCGLIWLEPHRHASIEYEMHVACLSFDFFCFLKEPFFIRRLRLFSPWAPSNGLPFKAVSHSKSLAFDFLFLKISNAFSHSVNLM